MAASFISTRFVGLRGLVQAWGKVADIDAEMVFRQEAHRLAAMMKETIQNQGRPPGSFTPLAKSTVSARRWLSKTAGLRRKAAGGTKALISTGTMFKAIDAMETDGGGYFVGVPRRTKARRKVSTGRATPPYALALIHEYGKSFNITVTAKMLRYIHGVLVPAWRRGKKEKGRPSRGKGLRLGGALQVVIPERPFIRTSFEQWVKRLPEAIGEHLIARGYGRR